MTKVMDRALVWLRRDLRCDDHAALYHALRAARQVWCAFVLDTNILSPLPRADRRVEFIRDSLAGLDAQLAALGQSHGIAGVRLIVRHGRANEELPALAALLHVQAVFANHDDEPAALARDAAVRGHLAQRGVALHTSKDHVIFERAEVLTQSGNPYSVFTPYKRAWLAKLNDFYVKPYAVARHAGALAPLPTGVAGGVPGLGEIGFEATNLHQLKLPSGSAGAHEMFDEFVRERLGQYDQTRDFPALRGPSYLGVHLRFGTLSIRQAARAAWQATPQPHAAQGNVAPPLSLTRSGGGRLQPAWGRSAGAAVWLAELAWRDFYHQLLHHHPRVANQAFKAEFEAIKWERGAAADALFAAWCEGRTGYPLVDAAMHQINHSGYMHNRLRMVTASFLSKDLGLDYKRGEAYFAQHLNDFDLAANNGGWQWAASTGCDAQPWFRIFNPVTQSRRFDAQGRFIRRYLPQLAGLPDELIHAPWLGRPLDLAACGVELGVNYPWPVVDHDAARRTTLERYGRIKTAR